MELIGFNTDFIHREIAQAGGATAYRPPLVGYAAGADPCFRELQTSGPVRSSRPSADAMVKRSAGIE